MSITIIFPDNAPGITKDKEYNSVYSDNYNNRYTIIDDDGVRRTFALGVGKSPVIHVHEKDD